jgi:prepilin-type N-terminal cleavage/methylation domain-containing protein
MVFRNGNERSEGAGGFTLVELMVGIAVSSLLIVGLFQLLTDLSKFQRQYSNAARNNHRRATLVRILSRDLSSLPQAKPEFEGGPTEFHRTTVATHPTEGYRLETRVRYFIRREDSVAQLHRESRWIDLQNNYTESRLLLEAASMSFRYRLDNSRTVRSPSPERDTVRAVILRLPEGNLTLPVREKSEDQSEETGPRPGSS